MGQHVNIPLLNKWQQETKDSRVMGLRMEKTTPRVLSESPTGKENE